MRGPILGGLPFATLLSGAILCAAVPASAQFPAELAGRVIDARTAEPIMGAIVESGRGSTVVTDASGRFLLRSPEGGPAELSVFRMGYVPGHASALLESGRTARVLIALEPAPIEIAALRVIAHAAGAGGHLLTEDAIASSGARTLGQLLRALPAVVVTGTGGREHATIRGSGADAVLVLVDGVPVNDPLTGEADLSLVPLDAVRTVRVLPGAQTARYGPRAEAGVIVVESRRARGAHARASGSVGSLGERSLNAELGAAVGSAHISGGARMERYDGSFAYALPAGLGGMVLTRANASRRAIGGFGGLSLDMFGAPVLVRVDVQDAERGLPGPMHALTPEARQGVSRAVVAARWRPSGVAGSLSIDASLAVQRTRHEDPAPAFGPTYFDTTRAREAGIRVEGERRSGSRIGHTIAAGAELRATNLTSSTLAPRALRRIDPGVFMRIGLDIPGASLAPGIGFAARADRWAGDWIASHDLSARALLGRVSVHAAHRSAFSPPAASDQFFRSGYAIAPNPDLEPERVPSEIEIGASTALDLNGLAIELGANAFRADIRGMIVWAPDYRFVWSPGNRDVHRSGGEAWVRLAPHRAVRLSAWASVARVTYDWPGDADTVQVVYRPRHSGGGSLDWAGDAWRLGLATRFTGVRYATPGHANGLPSYWEVDLALTREWHVASALLTTRLAMERVLDNTDSFVHGYPEPGRRVRLEVRIEPASNDNETRSRYASP